MQCLASGQFKLICSHYGWARRFPLFYIFSIIGFLKCGAFFTSILPEHNRQNQNCLRLAYYTIRTIKTIYSFSHLACVSINNCEIWSIFSLLVSIFGTCSNSTESSDYKTIWQVFFGTKSYLFNTLYISKTDRTYTILYRDYLSHLLIPSILYTNKVPQSVQIKIMIP